MNPVLKTRGATRTRQAQPRELWIPPRIVPVAGGDFAFAEAIAEFKAVIAAQKAAPLRDETRLQINIQWLEKLESDLRNGRK